LLSIPEDPYKAGTDRTYDAWKGPPFVAGLGFFSPNPGCLAAVPGIEYAGSNSYLLDGDLMQRFLSNTLSRMVLASAVVTAPALAQSIPAQSVLTSAPSVRSNVSEAPERSSENALDPASLVPDLPALSPKNTALVGGTITKLDRVRDELTVAIFGGGKMNVAFDTRTHIFQDGAAASASDLRPGARVYVDTILTNSTIFARNIRLKTSAAAGTSQGVVMSYNREKGELIVRDALSPEPLKLRVTPQTRLIDSAHAASVAASELAPGTLVTINFGTQQQKDTRDVASEISILAVPGASFTFAGHITGLDLHAGLLVLTSATDGKTYDIYLDQATVAVDDGLHLAADVTVLTRFDGTRYVASSVTVN
jgi:Domain of unknown function (DUF5666)